MRILPHYQLHCRARGHQRSQRGNSVVEFALLVPVLLLLLSGILEYSYATYSALQLDNAARAASAYAQKNPTDAAGIVAAAQGVGGSATNNLTVTTSQFCECVSGNATSCSGNSCGTGVPRQYIAVTVQQSYTPMLIHADILTPPSVYTASATVRMK